MTSSAQCKLWTQERPKTHPKRSWAHRSKPGWTGTISHRFAHLSTISASLWEKRDSNWRHPWTGRLRGLVGSRFRTLRHWSKLWTRSVRKGFRGCSRSRPLAVFRSFRTPWRRAYRMSQVPACQWLGRILGRKWRGWRWSCYFRCPDKEGLQSDSGRRCRIWVIQCPHSCHLRTALR